MSLLKTIIFNPSKFRLLILAFFIVVHLFFLNYNVAEWGDSYRILRAAEYIRHGSYPSDEKRLPLFSVVLSVNPGIDQVLWGRIVVFALSLVSLLLFEKISRELLKDAKKVNFSLLLFTVNPVLFYWSLRIMTDVIFLTLVLAVFWFYLKYIKTNRLMFLIVAGFVGGLSILTRFEGYLLVGSLCLGLFVQRPRDFIKPFITGLTALVVILPYLIIRNPFTSTYFEEPTSRKYDVVMVLIYVLSFLFSFGTAAGPYFLYKAKAITLKLFRTHYPIVGFILLELVLVLVWPAAVPRLFIPVLPFFILMLTAGIFEFVAKERINRTTVGIVLLTLLGLYVIGQYVLRLQFLVSSRSYFMAITLVQLVIAAACLSKTKKYLPVLVFLSSLLWSFFVIDAHKLIFISVKNAGEYVAQNLSGTVAYNDVSSVSDWYTNYKGSTTRGFYYNTDSKKNLDYKNLLSAGIDYLIITNEHNTTMTLDLEKRPYLELLKEFRYNVNGSEFFAKVIKLRKN